jgi:hypothetical protein
VRDLSVRSNGHGNEALGEECLRFVRVEGGVDDEPQRCVGIAHRPHPVQMDIEIEVAHPRPDSKENLRLDS